MELTLEVKQYLDLVLTKLEARRFNSADSYVEDGWTQSLDTVRTTLLLNKCYCGKFLTADESAFCSEHRSQYEQNKKLSEY